MPRAPALLREKRRGSWERIRILCRQGEAPPSQCEDSPDRMEHVEDQGGERPRRRAPTRVLGLLRELVLPIDKWPLGRGDERVRNRIPVHRRGEEYIRDAVP